MIASGDYRSLDEVVLIADHGFPDVVKPDMDTHALYMEKFETYKTFSRQTSSVFSLIG